MKADKINISETVESTCKLLEADKKISPALYAMIEMLLIIITILAGKLGLNSQNSSKPPSTDPNRKKRKKPGDQPGRVGKNLEPAENRDTIIPIKLDKRRLPKGYYHEVGFESRQVIDIQISRIVTEYRAHILEYETGKSYVAAFPKGVSRPIQYDQSIKAHAVYLSQFQLIPYENVANSFIYEASIPLSVGSLFNFNQETYELLEGFDALAKQQLFIRALTQPDETFINGKRLWLHNAFNQKWTYFYPHKKRSSEAMDKIGILSKFKGIFVHDSWKPYYTYQGCKNAFM